MAFLSHRFWFQLTVTIFIMLSAAYRNTIRAQIPMADTSANRILRQYKVNTAFQTGEELTYQLRYGFVKGGELKIKVGFESVGYDYYFHIVAKCYTTGLVSKMATVYDIYESWIDISTGLPIKAIRNVTENNYKRYNEDLFFQDSLYVMSMKSGRHDMPGPTLDIISAFFYARRFVFDQQLKRNETSMTLDTWFNEKLYRLKLRYKDTERLKTEFGKIFCLRYVPVLDQASTFKKEEDLQAWFTFDTNFVPVKIRIHMPVADIHCDLIRYRNLKNTGGLLK